MYKELPDPKGPSPTSKKEKIAIRTLKNLLDLNKIFCKIEEDDKIHNTDGFLQILDSNGVPIGTLEIQVKYKDFEIDNPKAKDIPLSIFNYSTITGNPVLFIGADNNKAYWLYICKELYDIKQFKKGQKTATFDLRLNNALDGIITSDNEYVDRWTEIWKMHQYKFNNYEKLEKLNHELSERSDPLLRITNSEFYNIHLFLDKLNELLNHLSIIKDRYYPGAWKIGFAYFTYEINRLEYTLYSIPFDKNDIQIREIEKVGIDELKEEFRKFITTYHGFNPIIANPENFAINSVKKELNQLLMNKSLYNQNIFLANEFIYSFTKKYHRLLKLEKKEVYQINEIKESLKEIDEDNLQEIVRLSESTMNIYLDLLLFLEVKDVKSVSNVYLDSYNRFNDESGSWKTPSFENIKTNWKSIIENIHEVYNDLIKSNFPGIKDDLPLFNGSTTIIFTLFPYDEFRYMFKEVMQYRIIGFKEENTDNLEIKFYDYGDINEQDINLRERKIKIDANSYEITYWRTPGFEIPDFEYMPMFNFVYSLIEESINKYFEKL